MPDEGLRDTGEAIVVSTTPDVCKTPPKMVPVPYTIVGRFNTVQGVTPSVRMAGDPSFTLRARVTTVVGDEAGVGGGVVSGVNKSTCEPISSSPSVRATGSNLVRHNDQFRMNNGNTVGRAIFEKGGGPQGRIKADGTIAGANPAPRPETPAEQKAASEGRGLWGKLKDWGTEAGHQVTGFGKGVYQAGEGMVTGIGDLAKGAYNASGQFGLNLDPAATQAAREGFSNAVTAIREDPGALLDAVVADYKDAIARGDYGEALGRGVVDIGSIFIPGAGAAGKVGKGAEAAGALGKLGEGAGAAAKLGQAGDAAADLGKLGEAAGKLGQAGDTAADVGKLGQAAQDAAQVGDAASTAGRVRVTRRISLREKYLGRTPGKNSRTGREVIERMRQEGKVIDGPDGPLFQAKNGEWYDLSQADMAHKHDAVTWWNDTGSKYGPRSPEVREWMLDSRNYQLEHYSINRSEGSLLNQRYRPPRVGGP